MWFHSAREQRRKEEGGLCTDKAEVSFFFCSGIKYQLCFFFAAFFLNAVQMISTYKKPFLDLSRSEAQSLRHVPLLTIVLYVVGS